MSELGRALAFIRTVDERRGGRIERLPWGVALFTDDLPSVWDANYVRADAWTGSAAQLVGEVEWLQRGLAHRKLVVHDQELGRRLEGELDWPLRARNVVMALRRGPDRHAEPGLAGEIERAAYEHAKREVSTEEYGFDATVVDGLLELSRRTARAVDVRLFGASVEGDPASYCELRCDGQVAQIEDVLTVPRFRNRGLARATVLAAAEAARADGHGLVFLVADSADWPIELYRRLGFDELGSEWSFTRPPE